jgi:kumamolisin
VHRALEYARSLGVPVCCASGDAGSCGSSPEATRAGVVFPASSPAALACGGTERAGRGGRAGRPSPGRTATERVWNSDYLGVRGASGGGVSGFFDRPDYQASVRPVASRPLENGIWLSESARATTAFIGRAVPDVAVHADPRDGYAIHAGGQATTGGGTSAAAPLCAAVLACLGDELGVPVGWINRLLYGDVLAATFRPVTRGNNDVTGGRLLYFKAGAPWNACTGLGSAMLGRLLAALRGEPEGSA